jgi:hypothetical protein
VSASTAGNDLASLIPPEIAGDVGAAVSYYQQAAAATSNIKVVKDSNGWPTVQLSPKAQAVVVDLVNTYAYTIPVLGQLYAILVALAPQAGAGPGTCSTDPVHVANPAAPTMAELQAWPHFWGWTDEYSPYPVAAAGTFEAYANPILEWNWTLNTNCFSSIATQPAVLLASLTHSWNQAHSGTTTRVVTRSGLQATGVPAPGGGWEKDPPSYDPIAQALDQAVGLQYTDPNCSAFDCYNGPTNTSTSFTINTGPLASTTLAAIQQLQAAIAAAVAQNPSAPSAAATTAKTAAGVTAAVAGSVTLTAIAWSLATGKAWDWALGKAWEEIKEMTSGSAALEARETRSRRRRRR